jgi:hypothetical protein
MRDILQEPTTITLYTDSSTVYHTLVKGTGLTLQASPLLQKIFVAMWIMKNKARHGLVVRWVPSEHNLADPLTRGVHSPSISLRVYKEGLLVRGSVGGAEATGTHNTWTKMGVRQRPSHRIRRASGPIRPALGPLAEFWVSYDPREPKEVLLRYRSAP